MHAKSYHSNTYAYALFKKWLLDSNLDDTKLAFISSEGEEAASHRIEGGNTGHGLTLALCFSDVQAWEPSAFRFQLPCNCFNLFFSPVTPSSLVALHAVPLFLTLPAVLWISLTVLAPILNFHSHGSFLPGV